MKRRYDISVGLPPGYDASPTKKYPALIATDGNLVFPIALNSARALTGQGDIEDLIVISVGAPFEEGDTAFVRRRVHEFSPPNWPMTDKFGQLVAGLCRQNHMEREQCVGGAPQFLNLIVAELIPRLTEKYRIDPDQLGLFGVSRAGSSPPG